MRQMTSRQEAAMDRWITNGWSYTDQTGCDYVDELEDEPEEEEYADGRAPWDTGEWREYGEP